MMKNHIKITVFFSIITMSCLNAGTSSLVSDEIGRPKENIYAGIGLGGSFNHDRETLSGLSTGRSVSATENTNRVVTNFFVGYGHTFQNNLFLGLEVNSYIPSYTIDLVTRGVSSPLVFSRFFTTHYKFTDYFGVSLLPGYRLNENNLLYAHLGASFRNITISENADLPSDAPYYIDGQTIGGQFGAGLAHSWTKHISSALDYRYIHYPNWKTPTWNAYALRFSEKSSAHYFGASIIYSCG